MCRYRALTVVNGAEAVTVYKERQHEIAVVIWMKVLFVLQVLSVLMTAVCLPLITRKLYFGKKSVPAATMSPVEQVRLQQIRDRRESLQKATSATRPAGDENSEDDSRYRPTVWKWVQPWDLTGFTQTSAIHAAMMNAELTPPIFRRTIARTHG